MDAVNQKTKGFSDQNAVFDMLSLGNPDAKATMMHRYNDALAVKGLDIYNQAGNGPGTAVIGSPGVSFGNPLNNGQVMNFSMNPQAFEQNKALKEAMINHETNYDVSKRTPAIEKKVEDQLTLVKQHPELLPQLVTGYGLDFNDMKRLGVV